MVLWYNEKHHSCHVQLLDFKIQQLQLEILLQKGPLPWVEFTEKTQLLTEIKDNIVRFQVANDIFLQEQHSSEYYNIESFP